MIITSIHADELGATIKGVRMFRYSLAASMLLSLGYERLWFDHDRERGYLRDIDGNSEPITDLERFNPIMRTAIIWVDNGYFVSTLVSVSSGDILVRWIQNDRGRVKGYPSFAEHVEDGGPDIDWSALNVPEVGGGSLALILPDSPAHDPYAILDNGSVRRVNTSALPGIRAAAQRWGLSA